MVSLCWLGSRQLCCCVRDKTKNTNLYSIDIGPSKRDTTLVLPYLDVTLDVFVRAQKVSSSISSTSNRVEISLAGFAEPSNKTSLYFVSVETIRSIRLEGECESEIVLFYSVYLILYHRWF